jgi:hypothetical protein
MNVTQEQHCDSLHEAEWQAPASLTICAKTSDQSAGDEFATMLPKPPISVNVRTPATRVPSASLRCCQPRSTPNSKPDATPASKGINNEVPKRVSLGSGPIKLLAQLRGS